MSSETRGVLRSAKAGAEPEAAAVASRSDDVAGAVCRDLSISENWHI